MKDICRDVTAALAKEIPKIFSHIWLYQFCSAESYILYRAERARLRLQQDIESDKIAEDSQETIILVKDGNESFFWDGSELRKRIEFANRGLDSHLTFDEIFSALKEDITSNITVEDLKNCIIKNSRKLIEKDPVFAVFAARIQLLYLYEDILGWNCTTDDISSLNEKQSAAFIKYIQNSVRDGLLHKDMAKYDLQKLSRCLDATYDGEFDAIALQSLLDNYFVRDWENTVDARSNGCIPSKR